MRVSRAHTEHAFIIKGIDDRPLVGFLTYSFLTGLHPFKNDPPHCDLGQTKDIKERLYTVDQ